jgi:hypothetical protein
LLSFGPEPFLLSKNVKLEYKKTVILPVVLYGSPRFRDEHRFKVSENRVGRRIFEPKRDEVIGCWRKLYDEELHN